MTHKTRSPTDTELVRIYFLASFHGSFDIDHNEFIRLFRDAEKRENHLT